MMLSKLFYYMKWANVEVAFEFLDSLVFVPENFVLLGRFRSAKMFLKSEYVVLVTFVENLCRINPFCLGKTDLFPLLVLIGLPLISSSCLPICTFFQFFFSFIFSLNGDISLSPHLLSSQGMIPFFTLCTCSPVKMWQIAEFKCSEM